MKQITDKTIEAFRKSPFGAEELCKSLKSFIAVFHYYVFRQQFIFKPFHDDIIKKLEDIAECKNEKKNLYIGLAPRFGKSQIVQYFICWSYARNPKCNFIMTSYGDKLVLKFSSMAKNIIESDLFRGLFGIACENDTTAKDLWKIENGGEFRATSLKGVITGFGASTPEEGYSGCILIDDYLKADNFNSEVEKQNCIDIYTNTLKSRLNKPTAPIICIAQRLAPDDLVGWLQQNEPEDWDFFIVPTLDENEQSVWEEKMPAKTLIKMRDTNPFLFYSQYQQSPIVLGGSVIKEEWFRFYQTSDVNYLRLFMTADTALKVKECNDYTAIGLWGITTHNELYLIDMLHGKWEAPDLERQFINFWNKWRNGIGVWRPNAVYIEDKASGTGLIQSIRRKGGIPVIAYEPEKDKLTRVMDITPYIESGCLYLPIGKQCQISKDLISECVAFCADMSHKHDDLCFVGNTKIATKDGYKNLKDIKVGDMVLTPNGYSKVLKTKNRIANVISNIGLTGTPEHKVFTKDDYFVDNLENLCYNRVCKMNFMEMLKWKIRTLYASMVLGITAIHRTDILRVLTIKKKENVGLDFIGLFGNFILERKYQLAMKFIIKTLIGTITTFLTLCLFRLKSIKNCIKNGIKKYGKDQKCKKQVLGGVKNVKSGIIAKMLKNGILNTKKITLKRLGLLKYVKSAEKSLEHSKTGDTKFIVENAGINSSTGKFIERKERVFNIKVENGMYYANDVLVSNCDMMSMALNIAYRKSPMKIADNIEDEVDAYDDYE